MEGKQEVSKKAVYLGNPNDPLGLREGGRLPVTVKTDEQMKVIGMDVGAASKGAIYVTTWTPEGLRYTEIPTADFYMPDPHGGNIGGNGSDDT